MGRQRRGRRALGREWRSIPDLQLPNAEYRSSSQAQSHLMSDTKAKQRGLLSRHRGAEAWKGHTSKWTWSPQDLNAVVRHLCA